MNSLLYYKDMCLSITSRPIYNNEHSYHFFQEIFNSSSWYDLLGFFKQYFSTSINKSLHSSANGFYNPLTFAVHCLLEDHENYETIEWFFNSFGSVDEVIKCKYIVQEVIYYLWTNPVRYYNLILHFINSPAIGAFWNFSSYAWVDTEFYENNQNLPMTEVDKACCNIFNFYKSCHEFELHRSLSSTKLPFNTYCNNIYTEFYWRSLLDELPLFETILNKHIQ